MRVAQRRKRRGRLAGNADGLEDLRRTVAVAAEDLSRLVETGRIARARRQQARRLLMEAWLAANDQDRQAPESSLPHLRDLLRRIDLLVAESTALAGALGLCTLRPRTTLLDLCQLADSQATARRAFERVIALERAVSDILRRTEIMVEHAEGLSLRGAPGRGGTGRATSGPAGGREDLELVWGETEGSSGP